MLERVLKLQNDLTRLYFVAERWTGRCGTRSDLWTCCRHAVDSLDGRYDDRLTDAFYFSADKAAIRSNVGDAVCGCCGLALGGLGFGP
jgi:F0F1-type ATP synthase beta subunit